jgi:hypothetical protein
VQVEIVWLRGGGGEELRRWDEGGEELRRWEIE